MENVSIPGIIGLLFTGLFHVACAWLLFTQKPLSRRQPDQKQRPSESRGDAITP